MDPTEQTRTDFEIKRMERTELDRALVRYCLSPHPQLIQAIEAYAVAYARAAVAIVREVQARG